MSQHRRFAGLGLLAITGIALSGCFGSEPATPPTSAPSGTTQSGPTPDDSPSAATAVTTPKEVKLEAFTPPPLAEIDTKAEWIDQFVGDPLKMLREKQAKETPLATAAEALALRNDSKENNAKIVSALGRLATDDSEVDYEATINRHSRIDVLSTNPILTNSVIESDLVTLCGFGLFTFDWEMNPLASADTVKTWQTSKDRMLDKLVLRDDLTWSDGHPITAHDVVFTFKTIMNPKVDVPAVRHGTSMLKWIEAYDDHTLVFFHKEALATNVWNMNFPIIPKHIYEKSVAEDPTLRNSAHHVKYEEEPVTGGPYHIAKRQRGTEIVLSRRDSYYMHNGKQVRDKPYFKEIRFRVMEDPNIALLAMKNGEIDEIELNAEQWVTQQTNDDDFYRLNTKASGLEWTEFQFAWNLSLPYFSDVRVRRALAYAFNHKEMLDKLFYGLYEPSNGEFHHTSWMAPKPAPPYFHEDLDKAEELLDEAGWQDHDGDGIRDKEIGGQLVKFEFTVLTPTIQERINLCALLKESLARVGIICEVKPVEFATLQDKLIKHEFAAAFGGWSAGADPDTNENIWGTGEMRNFGYYSNPEVDRLFKEGRSVFERAERAKRYARIHEILYNDQPYMWLYYRSSFFAFNKSLRGYNFSPRGPFHYGPGFASIYKVKQ